MGFWDGVLNVVGDLMDGYAASKTYPTLQDVIGKYFSKGYNLSSCSTFSATLVTEGLFGDKTVDLLVLDNGAVSVTESGLMGDEYVHPPRRDVPTPEEFMRLLREQEASSPSSSTSNSGNQSDRHQRQEKPDLSETTLFAILGKLCIADGPVNSTEEARIAALADDVCEDDSFKRDMMIEAFKKAQDTSVSTDHLLKQMRACEDEADLQTTIVSIMCDVADSDSPFNQDEFDFIKTAMESMNMPLAMISEITDFMKERLSDSRGNLAEAYKVLGCTEDASTEEIKSQYRRVCKDYHPDNLESKGLAEDFLQYANQKMSELREAYENVMKSRGAL